MFIPYVGDICIYRGRKVRVLNIDREEGVHAHVMALDRRGVASNSMIVSICELEPAVRRIPDPRTATTTELVEFADTAARADLIAYIMRNDRNACVTDEQMMLEYGRKATRAELRAIIVAWATNA